MAFLQLDNLTKKFGDFVAVDNLTLGIEKGEFIVTDIMLQSETPSNATAKPQE